jgi:hypothetical protein
MNLENLTDKDFGKNRIIRKFLFLPRQFANDWRWLAFADITERVMTIYKWNKDQRFTHYFKWVEIGFADKDE